MWNEVFSLTVHGDAAPQGSKSSGVDRSGRRFVRESNPTDEGVAGGGHPGGGLGVGR